MGGRAGSRTGNDGHDEEHVDLVSELVRDGAGRSIGRDGDGGAHAGLMNLDHELVCFFYSSEKGSAPRQRQKKGRDAPGSARASMWNVKLFPPASATSWTHYVRLGVS